MAHVLAKDLREAVLQAAIQGRLTEHLESDTPIEVTLKEIDEVKKQLIKEKKIKKEKLLSKITYDEIPFEAPDCWAKTRLQDCFYIHSAMRIHQSDWVKEGIPFLRGRELVKLAKTGRIESDVHITNELFQHLKTKGGVPQKNDILISAVGTLGKVYVVKGDEVFYYKDAYILCLDNYKLNPKFIKYLLESPYIQQLIYSDDAFGTTVAQLTISKMKNMPIILPPIEEQARIVAKVDEIMAKIDEYEKLENQLVKLKEQFPQDMKESLFQFAMQGDLTNRLSTDSNVVDFLSSIKDTKNTLLKNKKIKKDKTQPINYDEVPFDIPNEWKWTKLGMLANLRTGKTPPRSEPIWWGKANDIPWVSIGDMKENGFINATKEFVSKKGFDEKFNRTISPKGTLIMSFKLTIGRVSILDMDALHNEAIISIFPYVDEHRILQKYLFKVLPYLVKYGDSKNAIKGSTLNSDSLCNLYIPLPPIEEQQRIVDKLDELLPLVEHLSSMN